MCICTQSFREQILEEFNRFFKKFICVLLLFFSGLKTGDKEQSKYVYNMTNPKRGMAVIINNRIFDRRTQMGERTGTDVDAANLYQVFKKLGFEVHMFNNQKATEILKIMTEGNTFQKNIVQS